MNSRKKTVLLVDDDIDFIAQMRSSIEKEFAVEVAYDGEEALQKIKSVKPDCIVLDVIMDHLSDGLDTTKKIKENEATKAIPVIMLTSVSTQYDYRTQVSQDYFPYDTWLDKPVKPERLLEEIRKLVNRDQDKQD